VRNEKYILNFSRKAEGNIPFVRPWSRLEDDINMDLK
jgi:hypothetical protein